jgi:hypothetical protein
LIEARVEARSYLDHVEVWYGQRKVEDLPRLRGRGKHRIDYRHIIEWLVRKPGAFENYRYQEDLFPTSRFRMAYDALKETTPNCGRVFEAAGVLFARPAVGGDSLRQDRPTRRSPTLRSVGP